MDSIRFEQLREEHLQAVLDIYTHYILNTTATFHTHPLTVDGMRELVLFEKPRYRTFVIYEGEALCGYVMVAQHKSREAYDTTAEVSIYLKPDYPGRGIGGRALAFIERFAQTQDIHVLVATICGENSRSMHVFEQSGYIKCAHYKEVGRKFGRYLDIVVYQKIIS